MNRWLKAAAALCLGAGICSVTLSIQAPAVSWAATAASSFQDIDGSFAKSAILDLYQRKIIEGTAAGTFSPKKVMTRAEGTKAMMELLKLEPADGGIPAFQDVSRSAWYYGYVQAGVYLGLAQGKGSGKYMPDAGVTRQELAVWLIRFLKETASSGSLSALYSDADEVADWAAASVYTVQKLGLMEGADGRFRPNDAVTREEMAAVMDRIITDETYGSQISAEVSEPIQLGWQFGQTDEEFKASISASSINVIVPRWYFLNSDGTLENGTKTALASWAKSTGRKVWPLVGNRSDAESTHAMLASSAKAEQTAAALAGYAAAYKLDGLNLDFENVLPADRSALTSFVANLAGKLHQAGKTLSVCVSPDLASDWTAAFDYAALAKSADYMVLMGYDEHWSSDPEPGSVASFGWVQSGLDKLIKQAGAAKVIFGMPLYTRDWSLKWNGSASASEDLTLNEQNARMTRYGISWSWKADIGQYTASYQTNGVQHKIWLEDSRSLTLKYRMGSSRKIAGFAYWAIGGEQPGLWQALDNAERFDGYTF
ncbi:S-layer homology domain-containing protein [Paenibacillus pinistramenti]|uniref:S-layer homology domain-containing protein n=1 Tax=Paenibacillus pinistramenti TaxID=1768003 RepID=UPI0011090B59|nr:S-layer homology domain-containing protein [Paenibacillus pinistramenti]